MASLAGVVPQPGEEPRECVDRGQRSHTPSRNARVCAGSVSRHQAKPLKAHRAPTVPSIRAQQEVATPNRSTPNRSIARGCSAAPWPGIDLGRPTAPLQFPYKLARPNWFRYHAGGGWEEHPCELAALAGRRLVVCGETEEGRPLKVALVKKLTGDTTLTARHIRADYFTFGRTFKVLLVTNHRPIVREQSQAIWRRLRLVPFRVTIPENRQDKHLLDKLRAELPGILAWAVEGCRRWAKKGLSCPPAVQTATTAYRTDEDRVGGFLAERINDMRNVPGDCRVEKARVLAAYDQWAGQNGEDALTARALTERIRGHGYEDRVVKINKRAARCWLGMTLQAPEDGQ